MATGIRSRRESPCSQSPFQVCYLSFLYYLYLPCRPYVRTYALTPPAPPSQQLGTEVGKLLSSRRPQSTGRSTIQSTTRLRKSLNQLTLMEWIDKIHYLRVSTSSVNSLSLDGSDGDVLPGFVSMAHAHVSERDFVVLQLRSNGNCRVLRPTLLLEAGPEVCTSLLT